MSVFSRLKKVRERVDFGVSVVLFSVVYFVGIGFTAIVAKIVGHRFLVHRYQNSSWQSPTGSQKIERMY